MKLQLTVSFIFLFLLNFQALSFTLNNSSNAHFDQDEVIINVADNCDLAQDDGLINVSALDLLDLAEDAVNKFWNTVSTSRLRLRRGSVVSKPAAFYNNEVCLNSTNCDPNPDLIVDSDILITCNQNSANFSGSPSVLGATLINNIEGRYIKGAIFLINTDNPNSFDTLDDIGILAFLAHELGHAIGLGHSIVKDSLMYYQTIHHRNHLGWDDIDGVSYLYPARQPYSGCGTIKDSSNSSTFTALFSLLIGLLIGSFGIGILSQQKTAIF